MVDLELLAAAIFLMVAGAYYLRCAMRAAVVVEASHANLAPVANPVELAWYYRPAEVFMRQVVTARSEQGMWRR